MAGRWEGFTDDDIKNMTLKEQDVQGSTKQLPVTKQRKALLGSSKKNVTRERMLFQSGKLQELSANSENIPDDARLLRMEVPIKDENLNVDEQLQPNVSIISQEPSTAKSIDSSPNKVPVCLRIKEGKSYEVVPTDKINISSLEDFQARQKMMQEQNRQKKELLAKALADRKLKTHMEVKKLQQIQEELQKLDVLLSYDVGILRNQIEEASMDFMEAQKRYNKAEKEFLDAKLQLFNKLERKEMLTEHLCTIIEQNEMRKARKLSELMNKLELEVDSHTVELPENKNKGCTLSAGNEISYSSCNTLKNRIPEVNDHKTSVDDHLSENTEETTSKPSLLSSQILGEQVPEVQITTVNECRANEPLKSTRE